jgi:hypothetical protein
MVHTWLLRMPVAFTPGAVPSDLKMASMRFECVTRARVIGVLLSSLVCA